MFEGLGLGSRLALLPLGPGSAIPFLGAVAYSLVTPIGLAIGLGVRHTYNEDSAKASYVTGTFDSASAGILLYTGLVELLAHEFICEFTLQQSHARRLTDHVLCAVNEKMRTDPLGKVLVHVCTMLLGAGIMALLGRWA
jgi:zinc transporter 1/2/3